MGQHFRTPPVARRGAEAMAPEGRRPPKVGYARFKNDLFDLPAAPPGPLPPRSKPDLHFFHGDMGGF